MVTVITNVMKSLILLIFSNPMTFPLILYCRAQGAPSISPRCIRAIKGLNPKLLNPLLPGK